MNKPAATKYHQRLMPWSEAQFRQDHEEKTETRPLCQGMEGRSVQRIRDARLRLPRR
jgi:hypothetical protein